MVLLSVKSIQGKREYMEDRYAHIERNGMMVAMVCDGHGGYQVADDTARDLPSLILRALQKTVGTNVKHAEAIRNVIIEWGDVTHNRHSGSTLTGVAMKDGIVYTFNVGDSRTCMQLVPGSFVYTLKPVFNHRGQHVNRILIDYAQSQFFCTTDHDGHSNDEVTRVKTTGGTISGERLNGILSVTRALGDVDVGPGVSHVPDIYWVKLESLAGPAFLYSDGIYEMQRYQSKENFDDRYLYDLALQQGSEAVVDYAYEKGSDDNLTAMLVGF